MLLLIILICCLIQISLAIIHEVLLFVRTVIKVQQKNMSQASVEEWKKTFDEFSAIFEPMNKRLQKVANGILQRLEAHGNIAKVRAIRFTDILAADDNLVQYIEAGDVSKCCKRLEYAAVSASIVDEENCAQYHQLGLLFYNSMAPRAQKSREAAARNGKKFTLFAKLLKVIAAPSRSLLNLFTHDEVLTVIERVLVRVFEREKEASQLLNIYSWNFRTLRHLRILNNMEIAGNLWAPVLDAADEEFAWAVSRAPTNTMEYIKPLSKLFSLGVARFHSLRRLDCPLSTDWLDFLMEDEAVSIIQDLDKTLMHCLKNFCKDIKEMVYILPYYSR